MSRRPEKIKRFKPKYRIKKGDMVQVITGEDKGKTGKVLTIVTDKGRAFVEGVNIISRHTKPSASNPNGGIIKKEAPVHISNLMLLDPKSGEATKVGRKLQDGKIVRYAKKSGEVIN
ncbi:MAG: 50S ribosomal protein L24 [Chitinophagales bacterium]